MVANTLNLLNAALKQPDIKRFVLTSSYFAAANVNPCAGRTIDADSWNEEAIHEAWAPPPYGPERALSVVAASKAEMEMAAWKWHAEHKPHFVLNTGLDYLAGDPPLWSYCCQHGQQTGNIAKGHGN
jgi:nucleoside-diphosphate-sugar epimerase